MSAAIQRERLLGGNLVFAHPAWTVPRPIDEVNPPQRALEEVELLRRIARRDREAFTEFYDRFSNVIYAMALRILNDASEAADVIQEVFVQVWDKGATYNPDLGKPFSWVLTLARNRAIDRLRARNRHYNFVEEAAQEMSEMSVRATAGQHEAISQEEARLIRSAVETLPLEQRQAIEMAFLGGMTQAEISEALRQPIGTIKARIRRGMLKLRGELKGLL